MRPRPPKTHTLWVRKQIEVNTDPQRRCYYGCHAKSEMVWTGWEDLFDSSDLSDLEETKKNFESINPGRQYQITKIGERL